MSVFWSSIIVCFFLLVLASLINSPPRQLHHFSHTSDSSLKRLLALGTQLYLIVCASTGLRGATRLDQSSCKCKLMATIQYHTLPSTHDHSTPSCACISWVFVPFLFHAEEQLFSDGHVSFIERKTQCIQL